MNTNFINDRRGSCSSNSPNETAPPLLPTSQQQYRPTQNRERTVIVPHHMSSSWLVSKLLRNSDVSLSTVPTNEIDGLANAHNLARNFMANGDICLFHYPTNYLPKLTVEEMGHAFKLIAELGRIHDEGGDLDTRAMFNGVQIVDGQIVNLDMQGDFRDFVKNASQRARDQVARMQFSWYQFEELPREVVGRTYRNLRHVDIRQNASLTCIESIITQLPQLASLNISDCPNLRTLLPLAKYNGQVSDGDNDENNDVTTRNLNLRHLWVRGCNLTTMSKTEWSDVFDSLSRSVGPLERMTLSRNRMTFLESGIGKLKSLSYLFVEDNYSVGDGSVKQTFELPDELGSLTNLRFLSLCGNNITHLPRTMGRLNPNCDIHLHRNTNLKYPPAPHTRSVTSMKEFFHREKMALFCGSALFAPHAKRGRFRANERLYRPGGMGYFVCKDRFEEAARLNSVSLMRD